MYNRYIPQNDGSFRKHAIPEPQAIPQVPPAPSHPQPQPKQQPVRHDPVGGFLKNLLPREFDTGDLIIVLLLLLLAGDCEEERNTALLTLALYFFL